MMNYEDEVCRSKTDSRTELQMHQITLGDKQTRVNPINKIGEIQLIGFRLHQTANGAWWGRVSRS
jgi:hypothetical protein